MLNVFWEPVGLSIWHVFLRSRRRVILAQIYGNMGYEDHPDGQECFHKIVCVTKYSGFLGKYVESVYVVSIASTIVSPVAAALIIAHHSSADRQELPDTCHTFRTANVA